MDLKTKADRDYLILVYRTSVGGVVDYKSTTCSADQLERFQRLIDNLYIERIAGGYCRLTQLGLKAAKEAEELREQEAENTSAEDLTHLRHVKREFRFSLLSAVIGGLVTLLVEHLVFGIVLGKYLP